MLEDVKEYLESFNCKANRCEKCENKDKCYDDNSPFSEYSPEEDLNTIEETEAVIGEVLESMPHELVIPGIYKHFKHIENGIPNNYMYAVIGISEPIENIGFKGEKIKVRSSENKEMYFIRNEGYRFIHNKINYEGKLVVYTSLYDGQIWIRPYDMFMSEVDHEKYPDIKQKYRFELVRY